MKCSYSFELGQNAPFTFFIVQKVQGVHFRLWRMVQKLFASNSGIDLSIASGFLLGIDLIEISRLLQRVLARVDRS